MTVEIQEKFSGLAPAVSPMKLLPELAQVANNVRFEGGKLIPFSGILDVEDVPENTESLFKANIADGWLFNENPRSYVRPFLPGDTWGLTYFTDGTLFQYRPAGSALEYVGGLPRPDAPVLQTQDAGDTSTELKTRDQSYIVCWVDGHNRVGPTSDPSLSVTVGEGSTVRVMMPPLPGAQWYSTGASWRIFRSNTSSSGVGDYQFVEDVPISTIFYDDSYEPDELTYVAFSETWVAPPDDMVGLCLAPGDFLLGYTANEVYASEPSAPHAWPYSWGFQEQVKGIAVIQGGVLVVTDGQPWLLAGSSPNNIIKMPIESDAACVSPASLVDMGGVAFYAGKDGLYAAQGTSVVNITEAAFDETSWGAYQPSTIRAFKHEHFYVGFYGAMDDATGFLFDTVDKTFTTLTGLKVLAGSYDPWAEETHVLYESGTDIRHGVFDAGASLTGTWRSREINYPNLQSFSVLRLDADSYPQTVRVINDYETVTVPVLDDKMFKLPTGYKTKRLTYELEITDAVDRLVLATATGELV